MVFGLSGVSRLRGAVEAIKAVVSDSSLTEGALFGFGLWSKEETTEEILENTEENIYGESSTKYFDRGFRVNCLILYNDPEILQEDFGADLNASIEMYFHRTSLEEANFYPEIGDIVDWNDFYFEINSVTY